MVDIATENLLTLKQAAERFPGRSKAGKLCPETVRLWTTKGRRGVILQAAVMGGTILVSMESLVEFAERITRQRRPEPVRPTRSPVEHTRAQKRANEKLRQHGIGV